MKPKLVDDWRRAWRWWSVRLNVLGTTLLAWFLAAPDVAREIWAALPAELKAELPPRIAYLIPLIILFAANVARILKQGDHHGE
jgi:hypothetical protein